jgi:hypothetical protein
MYGWMVQYGAAEEFLRLIRPWLITKAAEADLVLTARSLTNTARKDLATRLKAIKRPAT